MPLRGQSRSCAIFVLRLSVTSSTFKMSQCCICNSEFRSQSADLAELVVVLLPVHRLQIIPSLKGVNHSRPRITGVINEKKLGQQIASGSELQKHTDRSRKTNTHTHMLIGVDVNSQVGACDEPDATKEEREYSATDSTYIERHAFGTQNSRGPWLRHWAVQHQAVLAITFFQKISALFQTCKDAETTGQVDTNSDHKAVIARSTYLSTSRHSKKKEERSEGEVKTSEITGASTRSTSTTHTKNTPSTQPAPARRQSQQRLKNSRNLNNATTICAATTQNEQPTTTQLRPTSGPITPTTFVETQQDVFRGRHFCWHLSRRQSCEALVLCKTLPWSTSPRASRSTTCL